MTCAVALAKRGTDAPSVPSAWLTPGARARVRSHLGLEREGGQRLSTGATAGTSVAERTCPEGPGAIVLHVFVCIRVLHSLLATGSASKRRTASCDAAACRPPAGFCLSGSNTHAMSAMQLSTFFGLELILACGSPASHIARKQRPKSR